jgi:hypothetical protein
MVMFLRVIINKMMLNEVSLLNFLSLSLSSSSIQRDIESHMSQCGSSGVYLDPCPPHFPLVPPAQSSTKLLIPLPLYLLYGGGSI